MLVPAAPAPQPIATNARSRCPPVPNTCMGHGGGAPKQLWAAHDPRGDKQRAALQVPPTQSTALGVPVQRGHGGLGQMLGVVKLPLSLVAS